MAHDIDRSGNLEAAVESLLRTGRYKSSDEVLREGVRLVAERDARLARFDAEMQKGIDDIEAGRIEDADVVFDRLIAKYQAMVDARSAA